eukprot:c10530_g1_i1.p2 GENE.c10530_g1_i1~~c10530_g1_i1.p2  ORF type:complete len:127 (+),score=35.03 c10530_g1_i1:486-866(+)
MFVAGCGNFNAGTPEMMHQAFSKLGALPGDTLVYVGHEYTKGNLQYAQHVEPNNKAITSKLVWCEQQLGQGLHTVPTTIASEHETNPFLRAVLGVPSVLQHAQTTDTVQAIFFVRQEKSAGAWKKS